MRQLYLIIICLLNITLLQAQDINIKIEQYATKHSAEKVHVHFDKDVYAPGETIWFKAYLYNEFTAALDSKTFYLDWFDEKGKLLYHTVSPLLDGCSYGQFQLPEDFKNSYIHVIGYTKWMLNFDSSFFYSKTIKIISKTNTPVLEKKKPISEITFFPEGGDLVQDLANKVAFKATDQWGEPVTARGVILNNVNKVVDSFKTIHDGMGHLYMFPQQGETYIAKWRDPSNVEHLTPLPQVKNTGLVIKVDVTSKKRSFTITLTDDMAARNDSIHIVGSINYHSVFILHKSTLQKQVKGSIPLTELPTGILTITVFDKQWNPVAERITFINNEEYVLLPQIEVEHWGLNKNARNDLKITVPDTISSNLSISITDAGIATDTSETIISRLLLSSDIKGKVFNPSSYFKEKSDANDQKLDLVMLTNGWRRFNWDKVFASKPEALKYQRDSTYLNLGGQLLGAKPGRIDTNTNIILLMRNADTGRSKMNILPIAADGSFNDPSLIVFDTLRIYYQLPKNKGLNNVTAQFMPGRLASPYGEKMTLPRYLLSLKDTMGIARQAEIWKEADNISKLFKVKTLEDVVVKSRTKTAVEKMNEKYASGLFTGGDGYQFDLVNDPFAHGSRDVLSYLQGKVAGLTINNVGAEPSATWRGGSPAFFIDEMPSDISFVSGLNISDIAFIKIFRPPFMGASGGANGAIAIYTRRGDDVQQQSNSGLSFNKVFGYSAIKEFYSPNYSKAPPAEGNKDLRTTLYWNPMLITGKNKQSLKLFFYNNDISKSFRIVLEGMSIDGKLVHVEQLME